MTASFGGKSWGRPPASPIRHSTWYCTLLFGCSGSRLLSGTCATPAPCPSSPFQDCSDCDPGYYCSGTNLPYPTDCCLGGYYCTGGATTAIQFPVEPGHFAAPCSYEQTPCYPGTFQQSAVQEACDPCRPGFYCPDRGMTAGILCPPGAYCPAGSQFPVPCPPGSFNEKLNLDNETQCEPCSPGMYCAGSNNTEPDGPCLGGYYCFSGCDHPRCTTGIGTGGLCTKGHYCPNGTHTPIPCPAGTWSPTEGNTDVSDCQACKGGYYCPVVGIEDPEAGMDGDADAYICAAGYYCTSACKVCDAA